jgi:hypothetical protein
MRNDSAVGRHRAGAHPENEALVLYEMEADETFRRTGRVVTDSSLGLVLWDERRHRRPQRPH